MFRAPPRLNAEYERRKKAGYAHMRDSTVVICGIARNIAKAWPATEARIAATGGLFKDWRSVIFENDSSDGTDKLIEGWASREPKATALIEKYGAPVYVPNRNVVRAAALADYRDEYRKYTAEHFGDFDYVVIVDCDLEVGWSYDGLANTFGHPEKKWDFVGSNGLRRKKGKLTQHDAWAYRKYGSDKPMTWQQVNPMLFHRGEPFRRVYSCFGGMGVYRMDAWAEASYKGTDCDHPNLHKDMRRLGFDRHFLNPSQIVMY